MPRQEDEKFYFQKYQYTLCICLSAVIGKNCGEKGENGDGIHTDSVVFFFDIKVHHISLF